MEQEDVPSGISEQRELNLEVWRRSWSGNTNMWLWETT